MRMDERKQPYYGIVEKTIAGGACADCKYNYNPERKGSWDLCRSHRSLSFKKQGTCFQRESALAKAVKKVRNEKQSEVV